MLWSFATSIFAGISLSGLLERLTTRMRIIAGKYRRRKILASPGVVTRPITDRVKETLFERLTGLFDNKKVADIFAGTGTLGLEALSRGAARATFIETDRKALEFLRKNIEHVGCRDDCLVWPADVRRCSFRPQGARISEFTPFEVIFFDPPYRDVADIQRDTPLWLALRRLARPQVSSDDATLIFRTPEGAEFSLPDPWRIDWTLEMSNMTLHIVRKLDSSPPPDADITSPT